MYDLFGSNSSVIERVKAAIALVTGLDPVNRNKILDKASNFPEGDKGSYVWKWVGNVFYNGKGNRGRAKFSGAGHSKKLGKQPIDSDYRGAYKQDGSALEDAIDSNIDDAAFKEETIEMLETGFDPSCPIGSAAGTLLNKINSPGLRKIISDGF